MSDKPSPKYPEFGARLKKVRKQYFATAVEAIEVMQKSWGLKGRTYFSHEKGDRMPPDTELERYARLFNVTPEYLRYGTTEDSGANSEAGPGLTGIRAVNQSSGNFDINASLKPVVRYIKILSAKEIKELISGRGSLAILPGDETLPVPARLFVSDDSLSYEIPLDDLSMVGKGNVAFHPGSALVVDPQAQVLPGHYVLAAIPDLELPIVRRYDAAKPYHEGVSFTLTALNAAYKPIDVSGPDSGRIIGRIIWVAFRP